MGWNNVKKAYKIKHNVCVTEHGICIGTGYIHDIIVIGLDGVIKKPYIEVSNQELARYMQEMSSDLPTLKRLIESPDTFERSITVFTYDTETFEIFEKQCEELGWPNATHDGEMMYENTFSTDRSVIVETAKRSIAAWIKSLTESRVRKVEEMAEIDKTLGVLLIRRETLKSQQS